MAALLKLTGHKGERISQEADGNSKGASEIYRSEGGIGGQDVHSKHLE